MLLLNPKEAKAWRTHPETGARFLIHPADSVAQNDMEARAKKSAAEQGGEFFGHLARLIAAERIEDWDAVGGSEGPLPCTPENRERLARVHENTIMPWLLREVRALDNFVTEEDAAAKNA